jgi:imidazolonepropionase-like amidohydrolase
VLPSGADVPVPDHARGSEEESLMTSLPKLSWCLVVVVVGLESAPRAQGQVMALRNVTLIDGTGAPAMPGTTVIVAGKTISAIGKDLAIPQGARVVDGTGKYVIPGLWDMHLHLRGDSRVPRINTYGEVLLLANGVTGARVMAGLPRFHVIKRAVEAGDALGPRIFISSRNMDGLLPRQPLPPKAGDVAAEDEEWRSVGTGEIPRAYQITTREQAREAMKEVKASGVEFVKIHNDLTPDAYFALVAEAKAIGVYVVGHAPTGVSVAALSDSGMRSIEHFPGMLEGCSTREDELLKGELEALALPPPQRAQRNSEIRRMAIDSFNAEKCVALAARLVRNRTWLSPTFMPGGGMGALSKRNADLAQYVFAPLRARWLQQAATAAEAAAPSPQDQELVRLAEVRRLEIMAIMKRGGVSFVVGTDAGGAWRIPGRSLHEGLAEMNKAGLTPMEVLQAATISSARLLGREKDMGSVQVGKVADLVVLDANPLERIDNTRTVNAVVANGHLLDRKALDELLAQLEAANLR